MGPTSAAARQVWRRTSSQKRSPENFSRNTKRVPRTRDAFSAERPELWNRGIAQYKPSPADRASSGTQDQFWKTVAQGVRTPLAGPVVPEVKRIAAMSR